MAEKSAFTNRVFDGRRYYLSGSSPYRLKRDATKYAKAYRAKGWLVRTTKEPEGWCNWVLH